MTREEGKPRWGEKTPHNLYCVREILEDFPESRFVHLIRDGRDVDVEPICSAFGPTDIYAAARIWKRTQDAVARWRAELGADQGIVRQTAWCRHDDIRAAFEGRMLGDLADPAVNRDHAQIDEAREIAHGGCHLHGKFEGGFENERVAGAHGRDRRVYDRRRRVRGLEMTCEPRCLRFVQARFGRRTARR